MVGREHNLPCYMNVQPQNVQSVLLGTQELVSQGKMVALGKWGAMGAQDTVVSAEERKGGAVAEADELLPEVEETILQAARQDTLLC